VSVVDISQVGCTLEFDVTEPAEIALEIAATGASAATLLVNGVASEQRVITAAKGRLTLIYSAAVPWRPAPPPVSEIERIVAVRPSRYCPSDRMGGFAATQFGHLDEPVEIVRAITGWVHGHLAYVAGSSGPSTDAVDTLLSGAGVCRDYAHLTAALCRARNIPARVAAVYAPGLSPMDFHLVVETAIDGEWRVWDATRLAPRRSLMRIATGRDAADTAFATTLSGALTLVGIDILAVAGGDLPDDDHRELVSLPA
jgi:transglutaminase-like putative cysteine protease